MKVITYQAPNGARINITPDQAESFKKAGVWPRNSSGEYCAVHFGLHDGDPDIAVPDGDYFLYPEGGGWSVQRWRDNECVAETEDYKMGSHNAAGDHFAGTEPLDSDTFVEDEDVRAIIAPKGEDVYHQEW